MNGEGNLMYVLAFVSSVSNIFSHAIAEFKNGGNVPIHGETTLLQRYLGADVVYILLGEANKQTGTGIDTRFNHLNKAKSVDDNVGYVFTDTTATPTDCSNTERDLMP